MMRAGSETGSLMNHVMSAEQVVSPVIGMKCTILRWTDRQAATVWYLGKNGVIAVRDAKVKRIDRNGLSECQEWECTDDHVGSITYFRKDKAGSWREVVASATKRGIVRYRKTAGAGLLLGTHQHYVDPSF